MQGLHAVVTLLSFFVGTRQHCRPFIVDNKRVGLIPRNVFQYIQQYPSGKQQIRLYHFMIKLSDRAVTLNLHVAKKIYTAKIVFGKLMLANVYNIDIKSFKN